VNVCGEVLDPLNETVGDDGVSVPLGAGGVKACGEYDVHADRAARDSKVATTLRRWCMEIDLSCAGEGYLTVP
jgi:hypothetical protein